jgi:putative ABC transport system permease protein
VSWIALKMLTGDRAKFFGIVLGLTFAALLIDQQGSIFCGLMRRTAGQVSDITGADLWVMDANVRYIDDVKPMIENNLNRVRGVEGVRWAVPLYKGSARAKLNSTEIDRAGFYLTQAEIDAKKPEPKGKPVQYEPVRSVAGLKHQRPARFEVIEQVVLLGLDDSSMVGAPPRERILVGDLRDLRRPDSIIVDFTRLGKLFPGENWSLQELHGRPADKLTEAQREDFRLGYGHVPVKADGTVDFYSVFVGRQLEMNDHRAIIVGVCEATRTFQSNAVIYTTYSRAKQYVPRERKVLSYVLAKTEEGHSPEQVAAAISRQTGLKARTADEFFWDTISYYAKYTGIPINFGITTILGFMVGTAIAGQTFYNFTLENLKQFGSLKAMGASNRRIVGMILLQATVVGLFGYGMGVGLAALFGILTEGGELAFYTPWQLLPITGGSVVLICILSSILSVRRVIVLEPAVVFRG